MKTSSRLQKIVDLVSLYVDCAVEIIVYLAF